MQKGTTVETLLNTGSTKGGIYRIFVEGWGSYYGETDNIARRWARHRKQLANGKHHCLKLRRAWLYRGPRAFHFEVLELSPELDTSKSLRLLREQFYISSDPMCLNTKGANPELATETSLPDREIYRNRVVCLQRIGKSQMATIRLGARNGLLLGVEEISGKFRLGLFNSNAQCKLTRMRTR